jgi:Flp pilus assembly CpaE family ATPase
LDDRVDLLVTRWRRDAALTLTDIEGVLELPVMQSLSLDSKGTYQALLSGTGVDPASGFGREIEALAHTISEAAEKPAVQREAVRKRRRKFFSALPGKYSMFPSQR